MLASENNKLRIALLHIAPQAGEVHFNRNQIIHALAVAAGYGAHLAITPELAESGYDFARMVDLSTVPIFPNEFICSLTQVAYKYSLAIVAGFPESDITRRILYNTLAYINPSGNIQGIYRKIHTREGSCGTWETSGSEAVVSFVGNLPIGFLIGEDIYYQDVMFQNKAKGARLLVTQMAWPKVEWDASKEWEKCCGDIALPLIVCNRTGWDGPFNFSYGESVVAAHGKIEYLFTSEWPTVFIVDFDTITNSFSFVGSMRL